MNCVECGYPATLTKRVRGVMTPFCSTWCQSQYIGWLEVPEDLKPWAQTLNEVLNELHTIHPHDQEACDFYNDWFRSITGLSERELVS